MRTLTIITAFLLAALTCAADKPKSNYKRLVAETDAAFFKTAKACALGENLLLWQRVTGAWPKNTDMSRALSPSERDSVTATKQRRDDSTVDNNATTRELTFLARLFLATRDRRYLEAVTRAMGYLLDGQYSSGGWPQFWPGPQGYQVHITYNDGNTANILNIFRQVIDRREPFGTDVVSAAVRSRVTKAYDRAIDCILRTQIRVAGVPTVWCQQHDRETFLPAGARAFELPSYCSAESAGLVRVLMQVPQPSEAVKQAVHGAMRWFDAYKLTGLRVEHIGAWEDLAGRDTRLVSDPQASPLWSRYYDLERTEPFCCDRDGIPRRHLEDIGFERRNGYAWYNQDPAALYPLYEKWAAKHDPQRKAQVSLASKGANETGLVCLDRRPTHPDSDYDAVVRPGESIQAAIEKAPSRPTKPFKILIRKGLYEQKVIIDRPHIVLVGEQKDSTMIRLAETEHTRRVPTYNGRDIHHGTLVLLPEADSCVISGLTVYNNYGSAIEPGNTTHQMAIFGQAGHTIIINCNVWADGNDALSLWAQDQGESAMYYHADLWLRCRGVDFLCPRGWCYATRCHFYGDGHAMIWHDGRGDQRKKLVITNSTFDAATPTKLGRWHHDSMFYLINCRLTRNVLDSNIQYAYSDKVLDPCPWGQRVYYLYCSREGGHSGWLSDNIETSREPGTYHSTTAAWTFHNHWDPEGYIRSLWKWLAY